MKFTCEKTDIVNAVAVASRATNNKAVALPILGCVLLKADKDKVTICGNSNGLAIKTSIMAKIEDMGAVSLDASMFGNIVRNMPEGTICVTTFPDNRAEIKGGRAKFSMPGRDAQEFPDAPEVETDKAISISQYTLKDIVRQTVFSAAINDTNPLMTGMLLEVDGDKLKAAAIDGHRIAVRKTDLRQMYDNIKVIVPVKSLMEVAKAISGDEVKIYFMPDRVAFDDGSALIVSRLIAGEYFDINKMLRPDFSTTVKAKREELLQSIERSQLIIREADKRPVVLTIGENAIDVDVKSVTGTFDESVDTDISGDGVRIGLNPKFLTDALRAIDTEDVTLYFNNARMPCVIKDDAESYVYLILPINITEGA